MNACVLGGGVGVSGYTKCVELWVGTNLQLHFLIIFDIFSVLTLN